MRNAQKRRLIEAGLVLDAAGIGDLTRGHFSVRVPGEPDAFYMKPHSIGLEEMTMESIVTCDLHGNKIAGDGRRHSEVFIHSEILRARPDLAAVVHVHPKYATAYSLTDRPWRIVSQACVGFSEGLGLFTGTVDLIRTPEIGRAVAKALSKFDAVLLQAHGVAVGGRTLEEAVIRTLTLEKACEDQFIANAMGGTAPDIDPAELKSLRQTLDDRPERHQTNFDYLVRRARAGRPAN